jgi:hypothetical protein
VKAPRWGEVVAFAGALAIAASLALRWYERAGSSLDAWETFGLATALLMLAALAGVLLMLATLAERSPALPVALAVGVVVVGLAGVIAAIVRLLERPDGASTLCAGPWVAFGGALLVLAGGWLSMRDERPSRYPPAHPEPRKPPA